MPEWIVPTMMGVQALSLALISRVRWRCFPDPETGRCTMVSGCTDESLAENHCEIVVEAHELTNGTRVLVVSPKS